MVKVYRQGLSPICSLAAHESTDPVKEFSKPLMPVRSYRILVGAAFRLQGHPSFGFGDSELILASPKQTYHLGMPGLPAPSVPKPLEQLRHLVGVIWSLIRHG